MKTDNKENSKERFWQRVGNQNYLQVMDADKVLIAKLFDLARGNKSLERFLHDNKLSISCLSNMIYGQLKHIHVKDILLVVQNLPDGSPVTKELLLAANGTYEQQKRKNPSFEDMEASILELRHVARGLPEPVRKTSVASKGKKGKEKARKEPSPKAAAQVADVAGPPAGDDSYDAFIDNLSFYGRRKPGPVLVFLKENQEQLFADRDFRRVLALYRQHAVAEKERRISEFKAFYASGGEMPENGSLSARYKLMLDTYVQRRVCL